LRPHKASNSKPTKIPAWREIFKVSDNFLKINAIQNQETGKFVNNITILGL
jgi:hypothetical protein